MTDDKIYHPFNVSQGDELVVGKKTVYTFEKAYCFKNEIALSNFLEENGLCLNCLQRLEPIYENNGFNEPDPTHYEITGYKPCKCQEEL